MGAILPTSCWAPKITHHGDTSHTLGTRLPAYLFLHERNINATRISRPDYFICCSAQADTDSQLHSETLARLRAFQKTVMTEGVTDEAILTALNELNREIDDKHLSTVERFALSEESKPVAWPLARLLIERQQFNAAAHVIVHDLVDKKENREYGMWKWWEYNFRERNDFHEIKRHIGDALLREFENGNMDYKLVVADLFGKGSAEAQLTLDEFKRAINFEAER